MHFRIPNFLPSCSPTLQEYSFGKGTDKTPVAYSRTPTFGTCLERHPDFRGEIILQWDKKKYRCPDFRVSTFRGSTHISQAREAVVNYFDDLSYLPLAS